MRFEGEAYQKALNDFLQIVPAFLGGKCSCSQCSQILSAKVKIQANETSKSQHGQNDDMDEESAGTSLTQSDIPLNNNCENVLRAAIVAFLMLWIFIAFLAGMSDGESLSSQ